MSMTKKIIVKGNSYVPNTLKIFFKKPPDITFMLKNNKLLTKV